MIVIVSEPDNIDLKNPRIGYQTYTFDCESSDITVSSENSGYPKDAPLRPDTYEHWQPTKLPATWEIDLGTIKSINYVAIAAHNLFSCGCTVELLYNAGAGYVSVDDIVPVDNAPIMFLFSPISARYWELSITGSGNEPKIGVIYIGQVLSCQRSIYGGHSPINLNRDTVIEQNLSEGGQFLGQRIKRMGLINKVSLKNLDASWYRQYFDPFVQRARKYPYFFAWRPYGYPNEIAYVWTDKDIAGSNQNGGLPLMDVSWSMRGIDNE